MIHCYEKVGKIFDNEKIDFLSDGNGVFREISGLEIDLSIIGLVKDCRDLLFILIRES